MLRKSWTKWAILFGGATLFQLGGLGGCIAQWLVDTTILRVVI